MIFGAFCSPAATRSLPLARLIFVAKRALYAAPVRLAGFAVGLVQAQCLGMMNFPELASVPSNRLVPFTDQLWLAVAAYLARFKGSSREHTESDLRCYLAWCTERGLDPLAARRPHLEL